MSKWIILKEEAFRYNALINYETLDQIDIGNMSIICKFCRANIGKQNY